MKYKKSSRDIETIKKKQMQIPDKTISTQIPQPVKMIIQK